MRIAGIVPESIVDGPGLRWVVFTQGCYHRCKGCHNQRTWNVEAGTKIAPWDLIARLDSDLKDNPLITGVTISGGEPFLWAAQLVPFAKHVRELGLNLWIYTGYEAKDVEYMELFRLADAVVCGPFIESERSLDIQWIGSKNQRIIMREVA